MKLRTAALPAAMLTVLAITLTACSPAPVPPANPPPISANDMAQQFAFNSAQARENHKDRWYTVSAGPVIQVRGHTAYADAKPYKAWLRFTLQEDAWSIRPNQTIRAVCQFDDLWYSHGRLLLNHCSWPADAPTQAHGDENP